MAPRRTFSGSGRNHARGFAPDSPLRSADSLASARSSALALLSRRDYTTHELRNKLLDRGYDAAAIGPLLDDLIASHFLDDRRVAAAHVRTATGIKGRGRLRVARELSVRGIPKDIVADVLSGLGPADDVASIRQILTRRKWPARPTLADRRRLFQHLFRRGFPPEAIRRALGGDVEE